MESEESDSMFLISVAVGLSVLMAVVWCIPILRLGVFKWVFERSERNTIMQLQKNKIDFSDIMTQRDIAYRPTGDKGHLLDIYRPINEDSTKPVIINVHGGGLFASYKETNLKFNLEFVKRGHIVINISYRLLPETTFWHQIDDVLAAFRYLSKNYEGLNIDLSKVFIVGDSAGALLTLVSTAINSSSELQEVFGIQQSGLSIKGMGLISIMLDNQRSDLMSVINGFIVNDEDKKRLSVDYLLNPSMVVSKGQLPPVYLVTSQEDLIQKDTLRLQQLLSKNGVDNVLQNYDKGKNKQLMHVFATLHPEWQESQEVIDKMSAFFVNSKVE